MSYVSHEWTRTRSWSKVHPYQVRRRLERKCTRESANGLGRSKSLISSLSTHLTSYVFLERTRPRSWPKVHRYKVGPRWENSTWERANGLHRSKIINQLIKCSFKKPSLTRMNSTKIWSQGSSLPSWTVIREKFPLGRELASLIGQNH